MTPSDLNALADRVERLSEMIMSPINLEVVDADKQAACDLIGTDTYGKPIWTVETISPCNRVVQAFAKHRVQCLRAHAAKEPDNGPA